MQIGNASAFGGVRPSGVLLSERPVTGEIYVRKGVRSGLRLAFADYFCEAGGAPQAGPNEVVAGAGFDTYLMCIPRARSA